MAFLLALAVVASPPTAADLAIDADRSFARADAAMNAQYRATMAAMKRYDTLPPPRGYKGQTFQAALLTAQRVWLRFREAECAIEGFRYRGMPGQAMELLSCKATLTRERTSQLKDLSHM